MNGAERDLLFGLIALQVGLIDQGQLVSAFQAWARDKARSLAAHLAERGDLDDEARAGVEAMVALHLKKHGGDARESLAHLPSGRSTWERLAAVGEPSLGATIARQASGSTEDADADRTTSYAVGTASAEGRRFRVLRPHARGGLGAVFVALDGELNREVALKEILDGRADDPASRQRFLLEAEITGGLEHPGIVPVYGLGTYDDGRPFYAMRFIRGDSLKEAIERFHAGGARGGTLELGKLLRRFLDVCNAIDYAHGRGVLHRDIKPGNIIVGKHGETLVVDWGLAKAQGHAGASETSGERPLTPGSASGSAETLPGSAMGTPAYMSPEQARGDLDALGPASDVYSLGATLYCLLTGRPPFEGRDVGAILRAVERGEFHPPRALDPKIDRVLEAICLKAMATRPGDRYPGSRALAEDIERWLADEPVSAYREPLPARVGRWARRHRTAVSAMGLSLATAVVLLGISNVLIGKAQRATARALFQVEQEQGRTAEALRKADENYRRARKAVEDYFTTVSEEVLLDEPGMQPLRERLLKSALEYHEAFLRDRGDDPSRRADLAESQGRYGAIADSIGRRDEALSHMKAALAAYEGLAREHPDRPDYRERIAAMTTRIGLLLSDQKGRNAESMRLLREAAALYEGLLRERPGDVGLRDGLATCYLGYGRNRSFQRGGKADARKYLDRANAILRELVAEHPDSLRLRTRLADVHGVIYGNYVGDIRRQEEAFRAAGEALEVFEELGRRLPNSPRVREMKGRMLADRASLHKRAGRLHEAIMDLREARPILDDLTRANPGVERYEVAAAKAARELGDFLRQAAHSDEAIPILRAALDGLERAARRNPGDLKARNEVWGALEDLGNALAESDRYEEAIPVLQRSAALADDLAREQPENVFAQGDATTSRLNLGYAQTRAGRHAEAVATYDAASAKPSGLPGAVVEHGAAPADAFLRACSLREVGRRAEAEALADRARRAPGKAYYDWLEQGYYDARGAALLARDGADPAVIKALADRAFDALRRAADGAPIRAESLRRDPRLDALRDREDFRLLLLDLAFPADPFVREP